MTTANRRIGRVQQISTRLSVAAFWLTMSSIAGADHGVDPTEELPLWLMLAIAVAVLIGTLVVRRIQRRLQRRSAKRDVAAP